MHRPDARPRSSSPHAAGAAIAVALGVLLLLTGTPPVAAAATTVADGHLDWGVKASFRSYVTGPVGSGTITVADDASVNGDGTFSFPDAAGTADHEGDALDLAFGGAVQFVAHGGALDLTIGDVRVTRAGATGALVADVTSRSLATGDFDSYPDIVFATLSFAAIDADTVGDDTTYAGVPASLTAAGSIAFADFYPAGTALDPLTIVTNTSTSPTSSTTTSTTSTTVSTTSTTTVPVGVDPHGTDTEVGVDGQELTVSPVRDLDPAGSRLRVTGRGYDPAVGIYLAICVDQGPAQPPSPCVGGVDTSGESESAVWISDDPPPYGEDLAAPFGPGGSFSFDLIATARTTDDAGTTVADCYDPNTRCVVATRADHTNSAERRADVKVPIYFVGQTPTPGDPSDPAPPTADVTVEVDPATVTAGGTVTVTGTGFLAGEQVGITLQPGSVWIGTALADQAGGFVTTATIPSDTAAGGYTLDASGLTSARRGRSSPLTVLPAHPAAEPILPATGRSTELAVAGLVLLGLGVITLVGVRRATRITAAR